MRSGSLESGDGLKSWSSDLLDRLAADRWALLAGLRAGGTIPISYALLREFIGQSGVQFGGAPATVESVVILPENSIRVTIRVDALSVSRELSPVVRILSIGGFPEAPALTVALPLRYSLLLSRLMRRHIDPDGTALTFQGRRMTVRLDRLLRQAPNDSLARLLFLVSVASIRTEPGTLYLDVTAASA